MQNPELKYLILTSKWKSHLVKAGYLTSTEVLLTPPQHLAKRTKLTLSEVSCLIAELAEAVQSPSKISPQTVVEILGLRISAPTVDATMEEVSPEWGVPLMDCHNCDAITTGDSELDIFFGGGVRVGSVTEIAGLSASGKSHLCLQLSLTAQLPSDLGGVEGGTIFISSEGHLPSTRLVSLAQSLITRLPFDHPFNSRSEWDYLDNIHASKAADVESLHALLNFLVPAQIERVNAAAIDHTPFAPTNMLSDVPRPANPKSPLSIRLLVIDSIAAPFRGGDHGTSSAGFISRSKDFSALGDSLKRLAYIFNLAVVVVNQVSDVFDRVPFAALSPSSSASPHPRDHSSPVTGARRLVANEKYGLPHLLFSRYQTPHFSGESATIRSAAALGHTWSNLLTTRVMLSLPHHAFKDNNDTARPRRMTLVFSPYAPRASVDYVIEEEGIRSVGLVEIRPLPPSGELLEV